MAGGHNIYCLVGGNIFNNFPPTSILSNVLKTRDQSDEYIEAIPKMIVLAALVSALGPRPVFYNKSLILLLLTIFFIDDVTLVLPLPLPNRRESRLAGKPGGNFLLLTILNTAFTTIIIPWSNFLQFTILNSAFNTLHSLNQLHTV